MVLAFELVLGLELGQKLWGFPREEPRVSIFLYKRI